MLGQNIFSMGTNLYYWKIYKNIKGKFALFKVYIVIHKIGQINFRGVDTMLYIWKMGWHIKGKTSIYRGTYKFI